VPASAHIGSERAAVICSTTGTAELNSVNPETGSRYVLANIADHPVTRVNEFCSALRRQLAYD